MLKILNNDVCSKSYNFNLENRNHKHFNVQKFNSECGAENQTDTISFKAKYSSAVRSKAKKTVLFATTIAAVSSLLASIQEFRSNKSKIKNLTNEELTERQIEISDKIEKYCNADQSYTLKNSLAEVGVNKNNCLVIEALVNNPKLLLQYFNISYTNYIVQNCYTLLFDTSSLKEASYKLTMINEINKALEKNPELSQDDILNEHALDVINSDSTSLTDVLLKKREMNNYEKLKNMAPELSKKFLANY